VELGGASEIVSLLDAGVPLVESQAELTPFQRICILKELERREEQKQAQMNGHGSAGAGAGASHGAVNRLRQPNAGGGMGGETITYVNEGTENGSDD
jgi:hypothetical protein